MSENQQSSEQQLPDVPQEAVAPAAKKQREEKHVLGQTTSAGFVSDDLSALQLDSEVGLPDGPVPLESVQLTAEYTTAVKSLYDRDDLSIDREIMIFHAEVSEQADMRIRRHFTPGGLETKKGRNWNEALITAATSTSYRGNRFNDTVNDPNAMFRQYLEAESGKIGYSAPSIKEKDAGAYSGEKAMLRVRSLLGYGGIISVPLYHSGFWVTMTAPSDGEVLELRRRLMQEKVDLGRATFGLVFSNEQVYLNAWMLDFCLSHIYDTNVRIDNPITELRKLIKVQDLNILFWGMARLIWPRGFDYVRPLTTVEGIENYQNISARIDIAKLLWVDNNSFNAEARSQLSRKTRGSVSVEEVAKYQQNFLPSLAGGRRVEIKEGVALLLAAPNAEDYINNGEAWITNIINTVDETFTTSVPDEQARAANIEAHSRAARLRNYGAWVKAVILDNVEITEPEVIAGTLEVLSIDDAYSDIVKKAFDKFIDDCTRALIAIPATNGKETEVPRFANLIPMDVINTFFTLLAQRVGIISRR